VISENREFVTYTLSPRSVVTQFQLVGILIAWAESRRHSCVLCTNAYISINLRMRLASNFISTVVTRVSLTVVRCWPTNSIFHTTEMLRCKLTCARRLARIVESVSTDQQQYGVLWCCRNSLVVTLKCDDMELSAALERDRAVKFIPAAIANASDAHDLAQGVLRYVVLRSYFTAFRSYPAE